MKIKMKSDVRLIGVGMFEGGKSYEVSDVIGRDLIVRGHAENPKPPKPKTGGKGSAKK